MVKRIILSLLLLAVISLVAVWWLTIPATIPASAMPARDPDLANGKAVFNAGGCASCHATPGQDDKLRLGGGLAMPSPFGTFYVPNLSPHDTDGIGRWTRRRYGVSHAPWHVTVRASITIRRCPTARIIWCGSRTCRISQPT